MSSNKTSTFQDEHKSDNEETPLVKSHQGPFASKQKTLEIIKRSHIKCGFLNAEHLLMIPKTWLKIYKMSNLMRRFQKLYIMPIVHKIFFLKGIFRDLRSQNPQSM